MESIRFFFEILFYMVFVTLIFGMIRPWWVLWFLDFKNRLTVLKIYGSILILLVLIRYLLDALH